MTAIASIKAHDTHYQSWKKGCSTAALLPEGNGQKHIRQKDFGRVYHYFRVFENKVFVIATLKKYHRRINVSIPNNFIKYLLQKK